PPAAREDGRVRDPGRARDGAAAAGRDGHDHQRGGSVPDRDGQVRRATDHHARDPLRAGRRHHRDPGPVRPGRGLRAPAESGHVAGADLVPEGSLPGVLAVRRARAALAAGVEAGGGGRPGPVAWPRRTPEPFACTVSPRRQEQRGSAGAFHSEPLHVLGRIVQLCAARTSQTPSPGAPGAPRRAGDPRGSRMRWRRAAVLVAALATDACSGAARPTPEAPQADVLSHAEIEALYRARVDSARMRFTEADVRFMTDMIAHHAQALVMAELAATHDASPTIRTLAARIINAQKDEIDRMQQWLRDRRQPVPEVHIEGTKIG